MPLDGRGRYLGRGGAGAAGESFMVTVRNDGNTLLTAGTIDLYREGSSQPFSSASIGFGANARMASIYIQSLPKTLRPTTWHT